MDLRLLNMHGDLVDLILHVSLWRKLATFLLIRTLPSDFPDVLPTSFWRHFVLHALHLFGVFLQPILDKCHLVHLILKALSLPG